MFLNGELSYPRFITFFWFHYSHSVVMGFGYRDACSIGSDFPIVDIETERFFDQ